MGWLIPDRGLSLFSWDTSWANRMKAICIGNRHKSRQAGSQLATELRSCISTCSFLAPLLRCLCVKLNLNCMSKVPLPFPFPFCTGALNFNWLETLRPRLYCQTLMIMPATILITHKIKGGKELRRQEFKFKPDDSVKRILLSLFSISFSVYFCGKKKKIII